MQQETQRAAQKPQSQFEQGMLQIGFCMPRVILVKLIC